MAVPSPAGKREPEFTARQILQRIRRERGKLYRMQERLVFCITTSEDLAEWLIGLGGSPFLPRNMTPDYDHVHGAFRDAPGGPWKWDIYINGIPVRGEETIWDLALPTAELYTVGDELS